jgi:hypothetical protein
MSSRLVPSKSQSRTREYAAIQALAFAILVVLSTKLYAQKAPVDLKFEVTDARRLKLQSVPIRVEIKPKRSMDFMQASSSAASDPGTPGTVTANNLKPSQTTRLNEKLLLTPDEKGYLTVGVTGERDNEFNPPSTVGIPITNDKGSLKFGKAESASVDGQSLGSQLKINASTSEAPTEVDAYVSVAKLSVDIQKGALDLSSKQVNDILSVVTTGGGVSVVSAHPLTKTLTRSVGSIAEDVPFAIAVGERGTITAQVIARDASHKTLYGRKTVLYVVSGNRKLYTGTGSFLDLDIQELKDDLAAHDITQEEYQQKLSKLLTGKVNESN